MKRILKRYLPLCLLAILAMPKCIATPMDAANQAYKEQHFEEAASLYMQLIEDGNYSATLYYNLGNALYRCGEYGQAILYYEKAHKLKPHDRDIAENLAIANSKTQDQITELPQFMVVRWYHTLVQWLSATGWKIATLCLLAVLAALAAMFVLSREVTVRKGLLIACACVMVILAISTAVTCSASKNSRSHNEAIILRPMVSVKSSPDHKSVDKFILHEGSKVVLQDSEGDWYKVRIADGNQGWLTREEIGII